MFRWFKRAAKAKEQEGPTTMERQIEVLRELGVIFRFDTPELVYQLLQHYEREMYEEDPYHLLLTVAGTDHYDSRKRVVRLSDAVWCFDTECVEDEEIYDDLIALIVELAGGEFPLEQVSSYLNFEAEQGVLRFELDGKSYEWPIEFNDDWVDFELIKKLGKLARSRNKDRHYLYHNDGQSLLILYGSAELLKKLNTLTDKRFMAL